MHALKYVFPIGLIVVLLMACTTRCSKEAASVTRWQPFEGEFICTPSGVEYLKTNYSVTLSVDQDGMPVRCAL